jgi:transposase
VRGKRYLINGVLWIARTGAPWRNLPERFGPWKSVFNRFSNWAKKGLWEAIFAALSSTDGEVAALINGTVIRAHQDLSGGSGGPSVNLIDRSRGGCSTKIHALTDSAGMPLHLEIGRGQEHDMLRAQALLAAADAAAIVADTAYDSDVFRAALEAEGKEIFVESHSNRKKKPLLNKTIYALRYNVERFFFELKRSKSIASRYEKTARNFTGIAYLACAVLWIFVGCI